MIKYIILTLLSFNALANPAKQIKKQMCFETYPSITINQNQTHEWTINEVINNPSLYKTYKLYTSNKTKINDLITFDFNGISHQYSKTIPVSGSAVFQNNQWTVNLNSQTPIEPSTYVSSLATWDMYTNINSPGTSNGFLKFDSIPANSDSDTYEISVVKQIDCKDFANPIPNLN